MSEHRHIVTDAGIEHKYFCMLPHTFTRGKKGHGLSLAARWLYVYLKSVAGERGECTRSTTTIVTESQLGRGTIPGAKEELVKAGLIVLVRGQGGYHNTDKIRIVDLWPDNMLEFKNSRCSADEQHCSVDEQPLSHSNNSLIDVDCSVDELGCSVDEPKKRSYKKNNPEDKPPVSNETSPKGDMQQVKVAKEGSGKVIEAKALHILEYFNAVHQRKLGNHSQIVALLKSKEFSEPVTIEDCKLVIDYLQWVVRQDDPEAYAKWVDSITSFRPKVFERHRDKARQWDADGRQGQLTPGQRPKLVTYL